MTTIRSATRFEGVAALCVVALLATGCQFGADGGNNDPTQEADQAPAVDEALAELAENASDYQAAILDDGVTRAEYEQAALDTQACIQAAGLTADITFGEPLISLGSGSEWELAGAVVGTVPDDVMACYNEHLNIVEAHYLADNAGSVADFEQQQLLFYDCLRDLGYDIPEDPFENPDTQAAVDEATVEEMTECYEAAGV